MTVALEEFNVTAEYLQEAFNSTVDALNNNSYILEMMAFAEEASAQIDIQKKDLEQFDFIAEWSISLNETVSEYFTENECVGLFDCLHFIIYSLNSLLISETTMNEYNATIEELDIFETTVLELLSNDKSNIYTIQSAASEMIRSVEIISSNCRFCDNPPRIVEDLSNMTAVYGRSINLKCEAIGSNLQYIWLRNDSQVEGETSADFSLNGLTDEDAVEYQCVVLNTITSVSTSPGYLKLIGKFVFFLKK